MSDNSREFFYVETCPALSDCSKSSWKNGAVWGWTEAECRFQLNHHLQNAGKHAGMSASDRHLLVAGCDIVQDFHHVPKKQRAAEFNQASQASGSGYQQPAIGAGRQQYQDEEGGENCDALALAQAAMDQEDHVGHVTLRQVEFDSIIDSVARASTCARSAQRLAAGAAKAFSDEVASLDAVKGHLQKIKENAEVEMRF